MLGPESAPAHDPGPPATESSKQVKATDEETEAQTFPDFSGLGPRPSGGVTLPYRTSFLGGYSLVLSLHYYPLLFPPPEGTVR